MPGAADLERVVRAAGSRHDVLGASTDSGPVRRTRPQGSVARHEATVGDRSHLLGRSCGALADVDCADGVAPCPSLSDDGSFVIDEAQVVRWGRFPSCAADRPPASPDRPAAQRGTP